MNNVDFQWTNCLQAESNYPFIQLPVLDFFVSQPKPSLTGLRGNSLKSCLDLLFRQQQLFIKYCLIVAEDKTCSCSIWIFTSLIQLSESDMIGLKKQLLNMINADTICWQEFSSQKVSRKPKFWGIITC